MLMQYSVRGPGDFFTLPQPYAACTALSYSPEERENSLLLLRRAALLP